MTSDGLIHQVRLSVGAASLSDSASDWERLQRSLLPLLDGRPLQASLTSLRDLGPVFRRSEWQAAATLAHVGDAWRLVRADPAQQASPILGLAIDQGTTTVVAELVDLATGIVLASQMAYNAQRQYGVDVTSRMIAAEKPGGLTRLRQAILNTLNELTANLCNETQREEETNVAIVIAGNTIMLRLLLGFDPGSIHRDPYVPTTTVFTILIAVEVGLNIQTSALIYLFPAASGYVGGDVTAGVLATGIAEKEAGLTPDCPNCQSLEVHQLITAGQILHGGANTALPDCGLLAGAGCC